MCVNILGWLPTLSNARTDTGFQGGGQEKLGVLSIPAAFDALGLVPGVIVLCSIAAITTWSDYVVGVFKFNHPEVYSIDDVGQLIFGRVGRIILGGAFVLCKLYLARHGQARQILTKFRLDFRRWFGYAQLVHCAQRPLKPWYLHNSLCGCRCHCDFLSDQHSHTGQD